MRILLTAVMTVLVTLAALTVIADDPFGVIQARQQSGNPLPGSSGPTPETTNVSQSPTSTVASPGELIPNTSEPELFVGREYSISIPELEELVHQMINEQRIEHGLDPLGYDHRLAGIARKHSSDMGNRDYFDHVNTAGEGPVDRGFRQGYDCHKDYGDHFTLGIAENIYQGWLYSSITFRPFGEEKEWNSVEDIAQDVVTGWMNSPGHRVNVLEPNFDVEGIGVAISPIEKVFVTQNFC